MLRHQPPPGPGEEAVTSVVIHQTHKEML